MISMELLDKWIVEYIAWWVPYGLMLSIPVLLAWFPGANARLRGHDRVWAVSAVSWLLSLSTVWLIFNSDVDLLSIFPIFSTLWTGVVVWSYGKRDMPLAARKAGRGFQIIAPCEFQLSLELAAVE